MQWEKIRILLLLWAEPFLSGYIRDEFVPGLLKTCPSFAPLGHAKGKFFIFLFCSTLNWLLVLFLSVLLALSRFSLALYFYCPAKPKLQQFSWCVEFRLVLCLIPSFNMEYKVTGRSRRKKTGWDQAFTCLQSFLSVPISFSFVRNFQYRLKNSCGVFLKILYWIRENDLFWKAVNVNYCSLALVYVEFSSDSKLVCMSSINLLNSGFLNMAFWWVF